MDMATDTMTADTRTRLDRYGESGALDHFLKDLSESDRGPFRDLVGGVNAALHANSREKQRIQAAREWSEEGRKIELGRLAEKLQQTAAKWPLAERATKARGDLVEVEHAALGGLVRHGSAGYVKATPTERTAEQIAVAREMRDGCRHCRAMSGERCTCQPCRAATSGLRGRRRACAEGLSSGRRANTG